MLHSSNSCVWVRKNSSASLPRPSGSSITLTESPASVISLAFFCTASTPALSVSPMIVTLSAFAFSRSICSCVRAVPHGATAFFTPISCRRHTSRLPSTR